MRVPAVLAVALALTVACARPGVAAPLRGIAFDASLDEPPLALQPPASLPTTVYLAAGDAVLGAAGPDRIDVHLAAYRSRDIRVILSLGAFPAAEADVERWRAGLQAIVMRTRGRVDAYEIGEVSGSMLPDAERYAYLFKLAAVTIRAEDDGAVVLQGALPVSSADWQAGVYAAGVAPYEDGVAIELPPGLDAPGAQAGVDRLLALIERQDPTAQAVLRNVALPDGPPAAAAAIAVGTEARTLGTRIAMVSYRGARGALDAALEAVARLGDLLSGNLVSLDERTAALRFTQGGADVTARVPHRLLFSSSTVATFLVYWNPPPGAPLDLDIRVSGAVAPVVRDLVTGASGPATRRGGAAGDVVRLTVPASLSPLIVDFSPDAQSVFSATVDVNREALPRVEDIIARYQQTQASQAAVVRNYIAHVRIEQHFRPTAADASYNLVTENRLFSDPTGVEWEELSFELNGAKWTSNRPAFPLVQPEKVLSLPLDLRLDQDYRYRLDGVETVSGREAFVVRFDPSAQSRALYRGTVWIDRQTYVRLKVRAVETRLAGPVTSNDETQTFTMVGSAGGRPVWLPTEFAAEQVFLIAGRTVLVERVVRLSDIRLNADGFESMRAEARSSSHIMYRDTDEGVRYFVKKGDARVVSDEVTTSAKAFALGTDIDPSFDTPLPIGGLNILDFNFLHRDMQFALLFGGVIAAGNIQHANLWGGRFDASVDFFGFALKSNDDLFDATGKRANQRVNRIPASAGFNLGYQIDPFAKVSGHYELKYDAFFRDDVTAPDFVVPSNTVTHGEGIGFEYRRHGYSFSTNATAYQRVSWTRWGDQGGVDFRDEDRTYLHYDAGLSKDFIVNTFHTIHLNGTYFGGQRLDRFSTYQFGLFDATRMHGVPSAVRFSELAMARGSYSFNLFDVYRMDLFLDYARGRDPDSANIWHTVTGTGIRLNLRTPRSTILQVDAGRSFLPEIYRGAGSFVLQILLLKPL